ncbi:MAG: DUF6339 family protein [Candidatus Aquilonibacter sp.]
MPRSQSLEILSTPFLAALHERLSSNILRYRADDSWIGLVDFAGQKSIPTELTLDVDFSLTMPADRVNHFDAQNAILLHRQLPTLTPAQASDPRLWTRLTHVEFWNYMRARWPSERYEGEKAVRAVVERYFVPQSQGRALLRNGIARLWWAAKLTYDESKDDPYELTPIVLSKLDIAKNLLERTLGRSQSVLTGFLEFLRDNEALLSGSDGRHFVRELSKKLNLMGGVSVLDELNSADVRDVLAREFALLGGPRPLSEMPSGTADLEDEGAS